MCLSPAATDSIPAPTGPCVAIGLTRIATKATDMPATASSRTGWPRRLPGSVESNVLLRGLNRYRQTFAADKESAKRFIGHGESKPDSKLDPTELAAYAAVAGVILNLDETITKE